MTIGSETIEGRDATIVRVLKVPWVESPSSDLNIWKKMLLTRSANSAPDAMTRPMTIGATSIEPSTGPIAAAVMAATDTEPIARCSTAAMSQASRMLRTTGVPSSAMNRSARIVSSPVSQMTAPSEPPIPVMSRMAPVV